MSDYKAAAEAFRNGLDIDPSNAAMQAALKNAEARIVDNEISSTPTPAPTQAAGPGGAGFADMLRGMGGGAGGGGGGMPDLASLMNNPMMMQMAQQMMANGGLERLMSNPGVANMVINATLYKRY